MKDGVREIRLAEYQVPAYLIDTTHLHFELGESGTLVKSVLQMRLNPEYPDQSGVSLVLHGVDLQLKRIAIDGHNLSDDAYAVDDETLTIHKVPKCFELECVTLIKPHENTSLEGLYKSSKMYCTQCEAEGFRKITYYLDRPDVMSVFTTTIAADKNKYPVLLGNGNDIERGDLPNGRHWVTWHDPFKKPAYLFAMVAGDLECIEDSFTTFNDREIPLQIFVEPENIDKCEHAMLSLKNAMRWDEEVYGREYDLDKFMIVAVNDFNMGAMENKGLNIFNSSCVLAKPETATDGAYERIEGVVAHEYFHNWSGNRVTCRDWFQLSLKEGFTVFRDQEFSADMGSRTVKRIDDVNLLRTLQFAEDAGPMAHPVRPDAYMEISNFYTVTIYEKGAEVVRMIHTLLGAELFRAGSDLYFERHDGQAVTTEDFVQAMQDASGIDLTQFKRWYGQAGTPQLTVTDEYDAGEKVYRLTVKQSTPDTPGQTDKLPLHIPFSLGLLNAEGEEVYSHVLDVLDAEHTFVFADMPGKPVPSLLRGFSAPVKLTYDYSREELMFLMKYDTDGFNRWDAGQKLSIAVIQDNIAAYQRGEALSMDQRLVDALRALLSDTALDKAMVARMLMMPSEAYLGELAEPMDIEAIHKARQFVRQQIAMALREELFDCYQQNLSSDDYRPDADEIARRSLKNICLSYLMLLGEEGVLTLCATQFNDSNNMTDTNAALTALVHSSFDQAYEEVKNTALESFYSEWKHDPLVVDQWFAVQASDPSENVFERVTALMAHEAFDINNPNKVRSLIGVFCNQNRVNFHRADGAGYAFLADRVIELDRKNPQIAARLLTPLTRWRKLTADRSELMQQELQRIKGQLELSKDVLEVVTKSL